MDEKYLTHSEEETVTLACEFAQRLERGDVIALWGELGTGKTRFVKGVCEAFAANQHVSSPSFVILNRYEGKGRDQREMFVYHLDLYRVKSVEEIYDLGYEEFIYGDGITLVEWPEQLQDLLPPTRYDVRLTYGEQDSERGISIELLNAEVSGTESRKAPSAT